MEPFQVESFQVFNNLSLDEKANLVDEKGQYLCSLKKKGYCIHFYSLNDFYVGNLFSTYKEIDQVVIEIIGFKKTCSPSKLLKTKTIKALGVKGLYKYADSK